MVKIPHNPDELLAVVDENDKIIGNATRKEVHAKSLLHRESYNYLINSKKQVLLQKRRDNNLWDFSSSGHFNYKDDYKEGAVREFYEELGVKLKPENFKEIAKERLSTVKKDKINNRFVKVFLIKKDIPIKDFKIDREEVEKIKYFNKKELDKLLSSEEKIMSGSAKHFIEKYIMKELKINNKIKN